MDSTSYFIPRVPDKSLVHFAQESQNEFPFLTTVFYSHGYPHEIKLNSEQIKQVSSRNGSAIRLLIFSAPGFSLRVERLLDSNNIYDKVTTSWSNNNSSPKGEQEEQIFRFLAKAHVELGKGAFFSKSSATDLNALSVTINALEALQLEIVDKYNVLLANNVALLDAERSRLAHSFQNERQELLVEHNKNLETIEIQRREFEKLKQQFDDRNNTHARREIRKDIKAALANRASSFRLSSDTVSLRFLIHAVCWLVIILSICAMWINFTHVDAYIVTATNLNLIFAVWLMLRSLLSLAVFVGTVSFYVKWQNEWFRKTSDAELLVRQTEIDIDRASWAIESALEWQISRGENIPPALLDGITRDLFKRDRDLGDLERANPADHLASAILGSAAKVRIDSSGAAVELDRKGISKLEK